MSAKTEIRYVFGSILRQLIQKLSNLGADSVIDFMEALHSYCRDATDTKIAMSFVHAIPQLSFQFGIYIVIDGIDECPNRPELCEKILQIARGKVKILVISRSERDIGEAFQNHKHVVFTDDLSRQDIATHIDWSFEHDKQLKKLRPEMKSYMKEQLLNKSNGM